MSNPIRLTIPASSAWVVLVRTAATACCARLDFGIDQVEDVRLAVDEVVAMLITDAVPGTEIATVFTPYDDGRLDIAVSASTAEGTVPSTDTFAWAVLSALVDDISVAAGPAEVTVLLRTSRSTASTVDA